MATQYAGGGRRSEAPTYSPRAVMGTQVAAPDEAVVAQLLQAINAPSMPQFSSGGNSRSSGSGGNGGNISAGAGTTSIDPGRIGAGINVLGYGAQLTNNPDLAQMASDLGKAFGVAGLGVSLSKAENAADVGKTLATSPIALNALGVPGQLAGAIGGFAANGLEGAATSLGKMATYAAAPVVGLVDAGLTLAGMPTVVDMAMAAMKQAVAPHNPDAVSVTDLSTPEASLDQPNFSDYGFSVAPDFGDSGWQSGTTDTGTTVGGPMSGDISGSDLGSIGSNYGNGGLSSGGYSNSWSGGGYGFGGGTGGMGD